MLTYLPTKRHPCSLTIIFPKPSKSPNDVKPYRHVSLLSFISKLFQQLFLERLHPRIENNMLISDYQFDFRLKHSTIDRIHCITGIRKCALEEQHIYPQSFWM